jgi:hypothetical protein
LINSLRWRSVLRHQFRRTLGGVAPSAMARESNPSAACVFPRRGARERTAFPLARRSADARNPVLQFPHVAQRLHKVGRTAAIRLDRGN